MRAIEHLLSECELGPLPSFTGVAVRPQNFCLIKYATFLSSLPQNPGNIRPSLLELYTPEITSIVSEIHLLGLSTILVNEFRSSI